MATLLAAPPNRWPLEAVASALGVALEKGASDRLGAWLDLLVTWNARVDLTAARSSNELVDLMIADALVLGRHIPSGARVVDVGTGAGAPGLALAVIRPDLAVTLVEPLAKRVSFLRTVLASIDRLDVQIEVAKGEALTAAGPGSGRWDVALARATLAPPAWLAMGAELVRSHRHGPPNVEPVGDVWVFLAREPAPAHPAMNLMQEVDYTWPLTRASRTLARFARRG